MVINSKNYNGYCACGKNHMMTTKLCVIERGCLKNALALCGISGVSVAVYDTNTYKAAGGSRPAVDFEVVLDAAGLHADDRGAQLLFDALPEKCDCILAIGAGTVHDITRYCAYKLGVPFVSCPTAASVDGFCSSVAVMTHRGYKNTMTAAAPTAVIADLDIIEKAPMHLTLSGFGDMVGKFVSLAEWKIAHLLTGEYFCQSIYDITMDAATAVVDSAEGMKNSDVCAYEKLTYGLVMSGIAMQLLGSSRCASGAEHHISHMIEMAPPCLETDSHALHGEKVGVGTLLVSREYHRLKNDPPAWRDYTSADADFITRVFGDYLAPSVIKENKNDTAYGITAEQIASQWSDICDIIDLIPTEQTLRDIYTTLGIKSELSDIGIHEDKRQLLLDCSPLVRNRLTLMRLLRAM